MATTTKASLDALIARVKRTEGWEVIDLGMRWKVTNSQGGGPLFVPKRPPNRNTLKPIMDELIARGWNEHEVDEQHEQERQRRIAEDRARNEARAARVAEAAALAAKQAAEHEAYVARRRQEMMDSVQEYDGYKKEVVQIDADFARDLLKHNAFFDPNRRRDQPVGRCNRPFDEELMYFYAGQMARGEWMLTHQGLALDEDGFLLDGQHRLAAAVYAADKLGVPDVTFTTEITYDLPPEVMSHVDRGKSRTPADVLALHGHVNRFQLATATKLVFAYDNLPYDDWRRFRLSDQQMLDTIKANPDIVDAVRIAAGHKNVTTASAVAAFVFLARRVYRGADPYLTDFLKGLRTGVGLEEGDPRLALRSFSERVRRPGRRRAVVHNYEWLAMLIKAWNYWMSNKPLLQMKFRTDEQFPRPIERE